MRAAIVSTLALLILTALGSYHQVRAVPYVIIVAVVVVTTLIALDKINEKHYPLYVYALALSLLWQTSMLGSWIVGADIHGEFYVASKAVASGWDFSWAHVNNTSVVLGGLTPLLAKLGISPLWQFKALYPAMFATVPMILYFAYRKMVGAKKAYFASLFFMIVPVFFVEIIGIVKSMVAEVFLALMVLFMVSSLKDWQKTLGIALSAILAAICHYTIGILAIMYLVGGFVILLVGKKWLRVRAVSLVSHGLVIVIVLTFGYLWYSTNGEGFMFKYLDTIRRNTVAVAISLVPDVPVTAKPEAAEPVTKEPEATKPEATEPSVTEPEVVEPNMFEPFIAESIKLNEAEARARWYKQEPLVRAAVGLDFADATVEGKVFRVLQYLTQLLIVIGFYYLVRKRMFTSEFTAGVIVSFGLLGMVLFFPTFSSLINASRFYHVSLFFLAPLLIIGTEGIVSDSERLWRRLIIREHHRLKEVNP